MVREQVQARGIDDELVLSAMRTVPRHRFVDVDQSADAYDDRALQLQPGQSISQPYIVGLMTQLAELHPGDRVLEIGTGSGYQAAVLAEIAEHVWTIEIDAARAAAAARTLRELHYRNVDVRAGNGRSGWPEQAPFDVVIVTAGASEVPAELVAQLAPGGRLVVPIGGSEGSQILRVFTAGGGSKLASRDVIPVRFVPLLSTWQPLEDQ